MSLRTRLLLAVLVPILLLAGAAVARSYFDARHEVQELFDAQLATSARLTLSLALAGLDAGDLEQLQRRLYDAVPGPGEIQPLGDLPYSDRGHTYEIKLTYQVWNRDGQLILRSPNAPEHALSDTEQGFSDSTLFGQRWRVFGAWNAQASHRVMTGQRYDVRDELINKIAQRVFWPLLWLPLVALLLWFALGRALGPLRKVTQEVAHRDARNLQPVAVTNVEREVRPLVDAVNRLLERLRGSLEKERRFTSDAAHELRTPLAALRTHAQLALAAPDEFTLRNALKQVLAGVERVGHLAEQLLSLARLEPLAAAANRELLDLHRLVVDTVAELTPAAVARGQDISVEGGGRVLVSGVRDALDVLIRNLVDNAIRYTPDGGQIRVILEPAGKLVRLRVEDSGPGIPENQQARVFERFFRAESRQSGCGIGLSLVRRVAEIHAAALNMGTSTELGGLSITVSLPGAPDSPRSRRPESAPAPTRHSTPAARPAATSPTAPRASGSDS